MDARVLTSEELVSLNNMMLGLGMPIERDDTGYNRPDFSIMIGLGGLPTLTDLQAFAVTNTLRHYKNTQLSSYKEMLDLSYDHYKELAKDQYQEFLENKTMFRNAYIEYCRKNGIKDFIHYISSDKQGVVVHYDGFVSELNSLKNDLRPHLRCINNNGRWDMYIEWYYVDKFLETADTAGKRGFTPDEELQRVLDEHNEKMQQGLLELDTEKEKEKDRPICSFALDSSFKTIQGNLLFSINKNYGGLRGLIFDEIRKSHIMSNVDCKTEADRITFEVNDMNLDKFSAFLGKNDIGINDDVLAYMEEQKAFLTSDAKLIDISTRPLRFTPYPFQIEDAQKLLEKPRCLMGHDMGTGKTFIAVTVGESIKGKKLVVVPETLRRNWVKEIQNVSPDADIQICKSNDYKVGKDWTICGYATVSKFRKEFEAENFNVMFIDEAHNIKAVDNWGKPTSQRASAVMELADKIKYVYPMTGTPIPTSNKDAYNILRLVRSDIVRSGFYNYAVDYCAGYRSAFGFNSNGNSNQEELHEELSKVMIRRTKAEVLPNLKKQRTFIPLETINKKYLDIEKRLNNPKPNETYMGLCMTGRNILSELKIPDTIAYAESLLNEDRSIVIVTEFNNTIDILKEHFKDKASVIRGGMSDAAKEQNKEDFQSGRTKVCLLNLMAGGVGLTLTKAHDMIINDFDWTPANMTQVEDRICRAGQTEFCNIFYMYCEKALMDTLFIDMLSDKSQNIDLVVDNRENSYDIKTASKSSGNLTDKEGNTSMLALLKSMVDKLYHEKPAKRAKKETKEPVQKEEEAEIER